MIQDTVNGTILKTGGQLVSIPVQVEMAYDEEHDPLAIQMIFKVEGEEEKCWIMARELIMYGSTSRMPYGTGDIRFRSDPEHNRVLVCLRTPQGHADVGLNREQLIDFLNRTQAVCKLGDEPIDDLIDDAIEELLS